MRLVSEKSKYVPVNYLQESAQFRQLISPQNLRVPNSVSMLDVKGILKPSAVLAYSGSPEISHSGEKQKHETQMETKVKNTQARRIEIIARIHKSLENGLRSGKASRPRNWLKEKGLSIESTFAVFNSGQIHHRKPQQFKDDLASVGFMRVSKVGTNDGQIPYTVFGIFSIMFPLRNVKNEIVNFHSIRIKSERTDYMNEDGIYPFYPNELTKRLYVTPTVIDAATLLEAKLLDNKEAVMALHEGKVLPQHEEAIKRLTKLEEIIFIDGAIIKAKENKVWDRTKK